MTIIKKGDKVKFIDASFPHLYGAVGTVIDVRLPGFPGNRVTVLYPKEYANNGTRVWTSGIHQIEIYRDDPIQMSDVRAYYSSLTGEI